LPVRFLLEPLLEGDAMADLVELLATHPGVYVGAQVAPEDTSEPTSVARIEVMALPGGSGVMMRYEVVSPTGGIVHDEHAVLARSTDGLVLVTSHSHANVTTVVHETEPGYFPAADGTAPFPMAIRLEVPEPGHLVYTWSYGRPNEPLIVRDIGNVRLAS
jgi:hypothetical protein